MKQTQLINLLLDQSKDLYWTINSDFQLIYANKSYLILQKEITGVKKKLNESIFEGDSNEDYIEKWEAYYKRALKGEYFEIEDNFLNTKSNKIQYSQITFEPLKNEDNQIFAVACQSKDITNKVEQNSETKRINSASLDVFCTINKEGSFVYVSATALNQWGFAPEELIDMFYEDLILEEDILKTNIKATSIYNGESSNTFVNRYKKKNGEIAYNLWSAWWDDDAKLTYCVARDYEEKIQQSEQHFKALVQEGSDLIAILDEEGNYKYVSPTSISVLGMKPEEFIGRNATEFIHPEDVERTLSSLQKITLENRVIIDPFRFQNHKKEWRWMETVLTNMLHNPSVNGIVANSRDITDKIKEKHKLKLLESVITNTNDAVLITEAEPFDEPGPKIIYVNEAFTKMTGYNAEEVIGKTPRILQGPNSDKEELAKLASALRNRETHETTTINYKKNGEEFWINFTVTPVADEKGLHTHWIAIERDITEQKNKELEKDLTNKIRDIFHLNIDNDIKECLQNLCEHITNFGDFDFVEIWLPAIDDETINRIANHYKSSYGEIFYNATQSLNSCTLGEGMPGYVWKNKTIEIWSNIDGKWISERKQAANKAGIEAMMGIPLKHKDDVIGVLLLGTEKTKSALAQYSELLEKLESTIGAELSRKKTEIELAQIFNFSPDIICVAGFDGYLKRINPAGLELLGYTLEEMQSRPIKSFIHELDIAPTQEKQKELYNGGNLGNFENRYITKQGQIVWLSWTSTSSPERGIVYAVAKNITEEKKLRELNRQVGEMAKIGSWEVDLVNQTVYWSDEVHQLHETNPKSFVPNIEQGINFYREDFRQMVQLNIKKTISTGKRFDFEAVLVNTKNKELWVRSIGHAIFEEGKCIRIYGGFQDINERKKAEIKLAESENKFRTILEAEPECIKLIGLNEELLMMNPAGLEMIGADNEAQVIGKSIMGIILPEHKLAFSNLTKNVFKGESGNLVFEIEGLKGNRRWLDTHAVPMKNEKGDIVSLLGVTRDITERKKAEQEKNSLLITLENSLNEIYIFDAKTLKFSYVNKGAILNLGYSQNEIKALTPIDLEPELTFKTFKKLVTPLENNEQEKIIFFTNHKRKDGSLYPVEAHLQLVTEGKIKRFLAIILDITERKKAEESILQSNERFEKVTEATNDAIWDWNLLNQTYYRSKGIERFFGKKVLKSFVQNAFWQDNFHPEDLEKIKKSINKAIENPLTKRWELEYRVINEQGKTIYVIDRAVIIRNNEGKAIRVVGAMTDISEQKQMTVQLDGLNQMLKQYTSELERSNEELEQFAFVASHDLQEPLRMISSFMELLRRKYGNQIDEKGHQYIYYATDGAKRMKQIILDLLDYSRANRPTEGKEEVNINEILSEFIQLRRKIILEKKAAIKSKKLPTIITYKAAITQILHCLLDNALKYSKETFQTVIDIDTKENETDWEFSISDNGIGIDPQFYDKIFVIFQRLHNQNQYEGTGIGLSIAKRHVEFLGGRIWLESKPEEGTTFYFTISKTK